jgi:hypothetical protein
MSEPTQPEPTVDIEESGSESEYETESELDIPMDESQPPEFGDDEIPEWAVTGDEEEPDIVGHITDVAASLFSTEEGETVCSALVSISKQLETQNRIMIKILAQLQKST